MVLVRVSSRLLLVAAAAVITLAGSLILVVPALRGVGSSPAAIFSLRSGTAAADSTIPGQDFVQINRERLRQCQPRPGNAKSQARCPAYFSWIDKDLAPWKERGISLQAIQEAKKTAFFRVLIVNGTLYMESYHKCFESRDDFTIRGLLLVLDRFPGKVPDVDLMFSCDDFPIIPRSKHSGSDPPPIFSYCTTGSGEHYDIVFPDWSFWGWPEINIASWVEEKQKIFSGAAKEEWSRRHPFAFWKGNYWTGDTRTNLIKCTEGTDLKSSRLITQHQDWNAEKQKNFQESDMSKQCSHRYKVYVEGRGWSASLKYIMSCGSTVLLINPNFHEFFSRSLVPFLHYWPIDRADICNSIRSAVDWGNKFPKEAEALGKCSQSFVENELSMDFVYQYMLVLLQHYSKSLRFQPVLPEGLKPTKLERNLATSEGTQSRICL